MSLGGKEERTVRPSVRPCHKYISQGVIFPFFPMRNARSLARPMANDCSRGLRSARHRRPSLAGLPSCPPEAATAAASAAMAISICFPSLLLPSFVTHFLPSRIYYSIRRRRSRRHDECQSKCSRSGQRHNWDRRPKISLFPAKIPSLSFNIVSANISNFQ